MTRNSRETDSASEALACGLVGISQVAETTREQLERIFSVEQFNNFRVHTVSFSPVQIDHVSLELAFYRAKAQNVIPMIEVGTAKGIAATEQGVLLATLPKKDDANKAVGTVLLVHKRLADPQAAKVSTAIASIAQQVKQQLG